MHRANPPPAPANFTSPPPSPSKAIMQKLYREKEGECFNTLRGIIKRLTGEELQTRHEILRKVIDLLSSILEMRQEQARVDPSIQYQMPVIAGSSGYPVDLPSAHLDYPLQSHLQPWQDPENAYYMQAGQSSAGGQQYHSVSNLYGDSTLEQIDYQGLGEHWAHDPQF